MLDFSVWLIFVSSALALAFAPGPGMLYVLSRTIAGGRAVGMMSTVGCAVGGVVHVIAAALGVSVILATSAVAFMIIKYLGAAFLIYLGVKLLLNAYQNNDVTVNVDLQEKRSNMTSAFLQGIVAEVLNPKTAIFFLAFIPQFIRLEQGDLFYQFMVLGMIVVFINMIPDFLIAYFSKPVERMWKSSRRFRVVQQLTSGLFLAGLGTSLALSEGES